MKLLIWKNTILYVHLVFSSLKFLSVWILCKFRVWIVRWDKWKLASLLAKLYRRILTIRYTGATTSYRNVFNNLSNNLDNKSESWFFGFLLRFIKKKVIGQYEDPSIFKFFIWDTRKSELYIQVFCCRRYREYSSFIFFRISRIFECVTWWKSFKIAGKLWRGNYFPKFSNWIFWGFFRSV